MKKHIALIIENEKGEILFVKRSMKKKSLLGRWAFPSGTNEQSESVFETAQREAFEELGITIKPLRMIASVEFPELLALLHFVRCSIINGNPYIKEQDEIDQIIWMKFKDFFNKFNDDEIGHGLIWLRKNKEIYENF